MYTLLVFLFKDVEFPQVAVWVHFALVLKERKTYFKIKVLKIMMYVVFCEIEMLLVKSLSMKSWIFFVIPYCSCTQICTMMESKCIWES